MNGASTQGNLAGASEDRLGRLTRGPSAKNRIEKFEAYCSYEIPHLREKGEEWLG